MLWIRVNSLIHKLNFTGLHVAVQSSAADNLLLEMFSWTLLVIFSIAGLTGVWREDRPWMHDLLGEKIGHERMTFWVRRQVVNTQPSRQEGRSSTQDLLDENTGHQLRTFNTKKGRSSIQDLQDVVGHQLRTFRTERQVINSWPSRQEGRSST